MSDTFILNYSLASNAKYIFKKNQVKNNLNLYYNDKTINATTFMKFMFKAFMKGCDVFFVIFYSHTYIYIFYNI